MRALTIEAFVDVNAVTVVETLERAREVDVQVELVRVRLVADARQVRQQVLVHVCGERCRGELLVIHGRVERECLVHDFDGLHEQKLEIGLARAARQTHVRLYSRVHFEVRVARTYVLGRDPRLACDGRAWVCRARVEHARLRGSKGRRREERGEGSKEVAGRDHADCLSRELASRSQQDQGKRRSRGTAEARRHQCALIYPAHGVLSDLREEPGAPALTRSVAPSLVHLE